MLRESLLEQELGRVRTRPGLPGARRRLVQTDSDSGDSDGAEQNRTKGQRTLGHLQGAD